MTEKVLIQNQECNLEIKADHMNLDSLHGYLREHFVKWCENHKYHPTSATIKLEKSPQTHINYHIQMHLHLVDGHHKGDYHSQGQDHDVYKAINACFHMMQNNITHHKAK